MQTQGIWKELLGEEKYNRTPVLDRDTVKVERASF